LLINTFLVDPIQRTRDRRKQTAGPSWAEIGEKKEICQGQLAHIQLWISIHLLFGLTFV
jgi:hypothetical protein